jgi:hypothetical protein
MPDKLSDERRTTYHALGVTNGSLQIEKRVWARCDTGFGGGWWGYKRRGGLMTTDEIEEFSRSALGAAMTYRNKLEGQLIEAKQVVTQLKASVQAADDAAGDEWERWLARGD